MLGIFAAFHSPCNSFIDFLNNNSLWECGAIKPRRQAVTASLSKDCILKTDWDLIKKKRKRKHNLFLVSFIMHRLPLSVNQQIIFNYILSRCSVLANETHKAVLGFTGHFYLHVRTEINSLINHTLSYLTTIQIN